MGTLPLDLELNSNLAALLPSHVALGKLPSLSEPKMGGIGVHSICMEQRRECIVDSATSMSLLPLVS